MNDSRKQIVLVGIFLSAFVLRAGLLVVRSEDLLIERDAYLSIARSLTDGHGYCTLGSTEPTAFRPPLFPIVIALLQNLVGLQVAVALVNLCAGTATVVLTWQLGRQLQLAHLAWLAAIFVAIDPLLLQYTTQPMTETLFTCLVLAMLVVATKTWPAGIVADPGNDNVTLGVVTTHRPSRSLMFAVGVLFGLCAVCRPTIWIFGGLMALIWGCRVLAEFWKQRDHLFGIVREQLPWPVLLGMLLVVAPWLIRNLVVMHSPIFTTTHGGYTLALGNNEVFYREVVDKPWGTVWNQDSLHEWQQSLERELDATVPRPTTESQRDRWMYQQAMRTIADHPAQFIAASWLRFRRFWNVAPLQPVNTSLRELWRRMCASVGLNQWADSADTFAATVVGALTGYYTVMLFLLVVGVSAILLNRRPGWTPLLVLILSFTLVHLFFWSNARMRAPIIPAIALIASAGVSTVAGRRKV